MGFYTQKTRFSHFGLLWWKIGSPAPPTFLHSRLPRSLSTGWQWKVKGKFWKHSDEVAVTEKALKLLSVRRL